MYNVDLTIYDDDEEEQVLKLVGDIHPKALAAILRTTADHIDPPEQIARQTYDEYMSSMVKPIRQQTTASEGNE
jgi:hypothetical protein